MGVLCLTKLIRWTIINAFVSADEFDDLYGDVADVTADRLSREEVSKARADPLWSPK